MIQQPLEINFGQKDGITNWRSILDGIMGGLSTGKMEIKANSVVFEGAISLENNGGFASLRGPFQKTDLSNYSQVEIRYKLTGYDFALQLDKDRRFWRPNFKLVLPKDESGEWQTKTVSLTEFNTYQMGQATGGKPNLTDWASIIRIGFISYGKKAGSYTFEVDYVKFY